jgi:drug/metabolite transporter (DMT)-like permease
VVVALVEPWVTGAPFQKHNLLLGILVIPGVALVVGGLTAGMHLGFWVGVASAALAALFNLLNKRFLGQQDAMAVTWIELGAGFLLLVLLSPVTSPDSAGPAIVLPSTQDICWLLVLAIFCTLIPFVVSLGTLRHLSAFTTQLAVNLEPVYAIFLAVIFLGEARQLDGLFFLGVGVILCAVLGHGWLVSSRIQPLTEGRPSV